MNPDSEPPAPTEPGTVPYPRLGQGSDEEIRQWIGVIKNGASWFYWIAGLTVLNSVSAMFNSNIGFASGLTIAQVFDALAHNAGHDSGKILALGFSALAAVVLVFLGIKAGEGAKWAFAVGIAGFFLDTLLLALDFPRTLIAALIHFWALWSFMRGYNASTNLQKAIASRPSA